MKKLLAALALASTAAAAEKVDFDRDIQPIFSANCLNCHGADPAQRKGGLRLDRRENAVRDHEGYTAIVPGKPDDSELLYRLTQAEDDERMPPRAEGHTVTAEQVRLLREWIAQGAEYAEHWSFAPPRRADPPAVRDARWARGPIDRFVLARLEAEGLRPAPAASKEALIRRATLDLTGLPPTPEETAAFLKDRSADAFARVVDRLQASPHYGERWARHWLDVARYADSGGFETDLFFGHAWRYRDYVIRAFNADKPFDRFIKEQVAGDELYPGDRDALVATGLYTTGPVLQEAGMVTGKLEYDQCTDAVDTTGAAFLGLTFGCARCHDHKYDPFTQKDYYSLQAVFAASDQVDLSEAGAKLRERAALKTTLNEFQAEQARQWARAEPDPARRDEDLRRLGDYYLATDAELGRRVQETERYRALERAVERYRKAAGGGASGEIATDADDGDDNAAMAFKAAIAGVLGARPTDRLEGMLFDLGVLAVQSAPRGDPVRRDFRALATDEQKRGFLLALGRGQLDLKKPEGYVEDLDALRLEQGRKHLADASTLPVRVLGHRAQPYPVRLLKHGELETPGAKVSARLPSELADGLSLTDLPPDRWRSALAGWIASPANPLAARVIVNRIWQWHFGEGLVSTPNDFGIRGDSPSHRELLDWLAVEFMAHGWSVKYLNRLIMLSATYQMAATADPAALERDPDGALLSRYQPHRLDAEAIWDSLHAAAGTLDLSMYGLPFAPALDEQEQIGNFRKWPTSPPWESNRRAIYLLVKRSFRFPTLSAFDPPDNITSCGRRDITTVPNQALTLLNNRDVEALAGAFARRVWSETRGRLSAVPARAWQLAYGRAPARDERSRALDFLKARAAPAPDRDSPPPAVRELCLALFNTNEFIYLQ